MQHFFEKKVVIDETEKPCKCRLLKCPGCSFSTRDNITFCPHHRQRLAPCRAALWDVIQPLGFPEVLPVDVFRAVSTSWLNGAVKCLHEEVAADRHCRERQGRECLHVHWTTKVSSRGARQPSVSSAAKYLLAKHWIMQGHPRMCASWGMLQGLLLQASVSQQPLVASNVVPAGTCTYPCGCRALQSSPSLMQGTSACSRR